MEALKVDLKYVYALLKVHGDLSVMDHLYIDRIDFCSFGNSLPFRIRIVNSINENPDYFYVKKADASRVYGLELEHLLSPNRLNYVTHGATLVEEHVAGVPGDVFIRSWLDNREIKPVRVAKELVKFNERCFIRLLGDMRSYNFVFVLTPDFEGWQVRIRAMDFDQQSYTGGERSTCRSSSRRTCRWCCSARACSTSRPRTSTSARSGRCSCSAPTPPSSASTSCSMRWRRRHRAASQRHQLREGLAEHFDTDGYRKCESMAAIVRENLRQIRLDDTTGRVRVSPRSASDL